MRIGLDIRYLSHGLTGGVRTYVEHLARHVPRQATGDTFVFYADTKAPLDLTDLSPNVTLRLLPWRSALSSLVNDTTIARAMARDRVDVAHFPANYGPRGAYALVVTVHDALNLFGLRAHLRGFSHAPRQIAMMLYLEWRMRRSLRDADALVTVSEHARHDIAARSGQALDRLTAIASAPDDAFVRASREAVDDLRARLGLHARYLLADGIKNPAVLIDAFTNLSDALRGEVDLVFFSREPTPREPVREALRLPGVRFVPRPSTSDLAVLMTGALAFVFPSFFEGFGLPLVEAMRCGTPVVASTRGSIPEVVGEAGLLFDLDRPADLKGHLEHLIVSEDLRRTLTARSLERSTRFDWRTTARETLAVYREAARVKRSMASP